MIQTLYMINQQGYNPNFQFTINKASNKQQQLLPNFTILS